MSDYLADSNLFLRTMQEDHPQYPAASEAIATLLDRGDRIFLVPQVINDAHFRRYAEITVVHPSEIVP